MSASTVKLITISLFVLVIIDQVHGAYKFICNNCAKDNNFVGFDDEDKFLEHCELHTQQEIKARQQLQEDARLLEEQEANKPKLLHCHFCQYVTSFNTSGEFLAHIEKEHRHTTIEENTDFIPQGKYKLKGAAARNPGVPPPDINQLFGGRGDGGYGGGYGGNIPFDEFGNGVGGMQLDRR